MQSSLLTILVCPHCKSSFSCRLIKKKREDIQEGELICSGCARKYPIVRGVPILLYDLEKNMDAVKKSFGTQWELHNNINAKNSDEKIMTWGLEAKERKDLFLTQMEVTKKQLKNKWLLDAGCGNGLLTKALADYGLHVVGLDLSDAVFFANKNNTSTKVHFVMGDVMHPPFKNPFDFVFSCGVLHHTYSTRKAFRGIGQCVKPGGRMWVWLYLKLTRIKCKNWIYENQLKLHVYDFANKVISRLPGKLQDAILLATIPLFIVKQEFEIATGLKKFDPTNQYQRKREHWKDKLVILHDNFTPRYAFRHTPEEVAKWFKKDNFNKICYNYKLERGGFGIFGDKENN